MIKNMLFLFLPLLQGYLKVAISCSLKKANLDFHSRITSAASKGFFQQTGGAVLCWYLTTVKKAISVMCV